MNLYFRNVKTGKRFKVISMDNDKKEIVLQGEYSQFTEPYDKERFKANGYILEQGDDDAIQSGLRA